MRFRRYAGTETLRDLSGPAGRDVLPVVFSDDERAWIARIIHPEIAALESRAELVLPSALETAADRRGLVLAPADGPVADLATNYASITGRSVIYTGLASVSESLPGEMPGSLIWIPPLEKIDIAESLLLLRRAFVQRYGVPARLGILAGGDLKRLTWTLAKQLLPAPGEPSETATILDNISGNLLPLPSATYVAADRPVAEAQAAMEASTGTLVILGHSRPHCGRLAFSDLELGVCGLESGGADGRCVDGVACHFGDGPRFVIQEAQAERIYYNGCSTGALGGRRTGLFGLPREAMLSHAVFRSAARQYIGNLHAGSFNSVDVYWLFGLSALGYPPAECVEMIDVARSRSADEVVSLGGYFGDPANPPWPTCDVSTGAISGQGPAVSIDWPTAEGLLVARLPSGRWDELARQGRLEVSTQHPSKPLVALIGDPWSDAAVVLAVPRVAEMLDSPLQVGLSELPGSFPREVGAALSDATENIAWMASLPSFREPLADAETEMERCLIMLRRSVLDPEGEALRSELAGFAERTALGLAHRFDEQIIDVALGRSLRRWELLEEYHDRIHHTQLPVGSHCSNCGSLTIETELRDFRRTEVVRVISTCSNCGIVSDLPRWPLEVTLDGASVHWQERTLRGRAIAFNRSDEVRHVWFGASLVDAGGIEETGSPKKKCMTIDPGDEERFEFAITHERLETGTMRFRVFLASRGEFGFVGGILLIRPEPH